MSDFSHYNTDYDLKNHIIIFGEFNADNLKKMLLNFYTEIKFYQKETEIKFLLVKNEEPSCEVKIIYKLLFLKKKTTKV